MASRIQRKDVKGWWFLAVFVRVVWILAACNVLGTNVQGAPLTYTGKMSLLRMVPEGASVDLSCQLSDPKVVVSLWQLLGSGAMYTPRRNVVKYGQLYTLHRVNSNMQGIYLCRAKRPWFSKNIGSIRMKPAPKDPPRPTVDSRQKTVLVGRDVNLTCQATGTRISHVQWYKHARPITMALQIVRKELNLNGETWTNTLAIPKSQMNYAGNFECRVFETDQDFGFWSTHIKLSVLAKSQCPELDGTFADPQRDTGYLDCSGGISTRKNCSVGLVWIDNKKTCGIPVPVIRWETTNHSSFQRMSKTVGNTVAFNCRLSDPKVRVKLKQKTTSGVFVERFTDGCRVSRDGQKFVIHAVNFNDAGFYYCEAPLIKIRRKEIAYLQVEAAPSSAIYQGYRNLFVSLGSSFDLNCGAPKIFQPMIFLEIVGMNGIKQLTPDGKRVTKTGRILTIHGVDKSMRGKVVCRVISSCNQAQEDVDLGQLLPVPPKRTPPRLEVLQRYSVIYEGEMKFINCSVSGGEPHSITWFRNKEPVSEKHIRNSAFWSVLALRDVRKSDAGHYECRVADFGVGYWVKTATVKVLGRRTEGVVDPPTPAVGSDKTIGFGEDVSFTCQATGTRISRVQWYKHARPISMTLQTVRKASNLRWTNTLAIKNAKYNDAGSYECRVFASDQDLRFWSTHVELGFFENQLRPTQVTPYQSVNIICNMFQADLELKLWQKGFSSEVLFQRFPDGVIITRQGNVFTITQGRQSDGGTYYCQNAGSRKIEAAFLVFEYIQLPVKAVWVPNKSKNLEHSGDADLVCLVYSSVPADTSVWLKTDRAGNKKNITSDKLHTIKTNRTGPEGELVLQIRNATEQDSGTYTCRAQFGDDIKEDTIQLAVEGPKKGQVLLHSGSKVVNESQTAEFWIRADGSPQPKITWKRHGHVLGECGLRWGAINCQTFSKRYKVWFSKGTSFIRVPNTVFPEDSGAYTCDVENTVGGENVTLQLTVQVKPSIKKNASNIVMFINAKKNLYLNCSITHSSPPPTLSWWYKTCSKDVTVCKPSLEGWGRMNTSSLEQVFIPPNQDHVLYKCIAENKLGYDDVTYTILRRADDNPPRITSFTTNTSVNASQNVRLFCQTEGQPPFADIRWFKNGISVGSCEGELQQNKTCLLHRHQRTYTITWRGSGAELMIKNVFSYDSGNFSCVASNAFGVDNKTVSLIVYEKPEFREKKGRDVFLSFQDATVIRYTASRGHPEPHFDWFHQEIEICSSGCGPDVKKWRRVPRHVISDQVSSRSSSLYLAPASKGYFFRCIAHNCLGQDDVVFSVHRMDSQSVLPEIIPSTPVLRVDETSSLTIVCQAWSGDFDYLEWHKKGRTQELRAMPIGTRGNRHNITSTITISHAQLDDAGEYLCYGYKWNDTKISAITVNVTELVAPVVSLSSQIIQEEKANHTTLACDITSGYPEPNITWYKDGVKLSLLALRSADDCRINGFHYMENQRPPYSKDLVICKPSHVTNTGAYKCEAKNIKGCNASEAFLNVLAHPKITNMVDHKLPMDLGDKVNETCHAIGNPTPSVKWVKKTADGHHVPVTQENGKNHTLHIKSLEEQHYGYYICVAENKFGNDTVLLSVVKPAPTGAINSPGSSSKITFIIAIVVSVALLMVLIIIVAILYRRRQLYGGFYICSTPPMPDMIPRLDSSIPLIEQVNKLPYDKRWEFPRELLRFGKVLGAGAFGEVYLAEAEGWIVSETMTTKSSRHRLSSKRNSRRGSTISQGPIKVAVKTLKEGADDSEHKDLLSELKILIHVGSHKNIVNLLAACTKGRCCDICVVIEYCPYGNMLHFLRNKRDMYNPIWLPPTEDPDQEFSMTDVVSAAFQVARAMEFLASRKCVHRDLAARNVLVGDNYVVKVADFGLARDVYKSDTYIKVSPGLVPVKWMAIESLADQIYSEQSDVWSFGVFLWELFTLGGNPYPSLPPAEIYQYIIEGNRMEQPVDCPDEMYAMMLDCWMENPADRPNFTALVQRLDHVIESNIAAMGHEGYLALEDSPVTPTEETDEDGYLKPVEIVPPSYKTALLNGNINTGSNKELQGSNRSLTNETKPKELPHERYTELGFKPPTNNTANELPAETAL